jgi:hypothetical protein
MYRLHAVSTISMDCVRIKRLRKRPLTILHQLYTTATTASFVSLSIDTCRSHVWETNLLGPVLFLISAAIDGGRVHGYLLLPINLADFF